MTNKTLNNTIAFQGVPGAFSEMACLTNFKNMKTLACPSFEEMIVKSLITKNCTKHCFGESKYNGFPASFDAGNPNVMDSPLLLKK